MRIIAIVLVGLFLGSGSIVDAVELTPEDSVFLIKSSEDADHNWRKTSSQMEVIQADTHEYTAWHNFVRRTRKCDITHKIRTDVWYCDLHNHTKSEVSLEETIHSRNHHSDE